MALRLPPQDTDATLGVGGDAGIHGLKAELIHYDFINDGEEVSPGSRSIVRAFFEPDADFDVVSVRVVDAETLRFHVDSGILRSGTVLVLSRGY